MSAHAKVSVATALAMVYAAIATETAFFSEQDSSLSYQDKLSIGISVILSTGVLAALAAYHFYESRGQEFSGIPLSRNESDTLVGMLLAFVCQGTVLKFASEANISPALRVIIMLMADALAFLLPRALHVYCQTEGLRADLTYGENVALSAALAGLNGFLLGGAIGYAFGDREGLLIGAPVGTVICGLVAAGCVHDRRAATVDGYNLLRDTEPSMI